MCWLGACAWGGCHACPAAGKSRFLLQPAVTRHRELEGQMQRAGTGAKLGAKGGVAGAGRVLGRVRTQDPGGGREGLTNNPPSPRPPPPPLTLKDASWLKGPHCTNNGSRQPLGGDRAGPHTHGVPRTTDGELYFFWCHFPTF